MKRPLAYLTAAWSGQPEIDMELAAGYCRLAYEAGFSPICPLIYLPLFLDDGVPEEHKAGIDMARDMLRRSHTLIVCGETVDEDVKNDIAVAGRLGIAATTLEGVLAVKGHGRNATLSWEVCLTGSGSFPLLPPGAESARCGPARLRKPRFPLPDGTSRKWSTWGTLRRLTAGRLNPSM